MTLRVPEQHPHVDLPVGRRVQEVQERAPTAGKPGIQFQEGHADPDRGRGRLDGSGDLVEGLRPVDQRLDQVARPQREGR